MVAMTSTGETANQAAKKAFPVTLTESNWGIVKAAREGVAQMVRDTETEYSGQLLAWTRARGYRSSLSVPMLLTGKVIGTVSVTRREPGAFSDQQVELLRTFADQAVIAIENARLFNETNEALERQTATAEILKVISRSPTDVQPVFDVIVITAKRLLNAYGSFVALRVDDKLHLAAQTETSKVGDDAQRTLFPMRISPQSILGRVVQSKAPAIRVDIESDADVLQRERESARLRGYRSGLYVPMIRAGEVVGTLGVGRKEPGTFADREVELLQTFAAQAAIAIENVRLFKELEARNKDLGESLEQQTATSEVLKVISQTRVDLQPVLQTILENARRLCDTDRAMVWQPDEDGNLVPITFVSPDDSPKASIDIIKMRPLKPDRSSAAGRAVLERRPIHIPDVTADAEYQRLDIAKASGFRTILAVPMLREGVPIGVLSVTRRPERKPFTERQIALLTTFADQAVIVVENVRLFREIEDKTHQ
ncbi:MAG TPA: GAF domain-containing protein, partial [Blastocatellia bacterium]|nr:GAF domain-containing protein [Blastocatellia bacterium]